MNRRGNIMAIIFMVGILFLLIFIGVLLAVGAAIINWTMDEALPEFSGLGMVGNINMTAASDYTLTPVNTFVQSMTWMAGVFYMIALAMSFGFAFAFRFTGSKWLMGFFISCMLLLVIAAIFISNIYEDFYNDSGDLGDRLKEQAMLSWLILYSPLVICVIGFICGIIIFTGEGGEQYNAI